MKSTVSLGNIQIELKQKYLHTIVERLKIIFIVDRFMDRRMEMDGFISVLGLYIFMTTF